MRKLWEVMYGKNGKMEGIDFYVEDVKLERHRFNWENGYKCRKCTL